METYSTHLNKYKMTKEQNIFWVKRNIVDYIWKSANLEGIQITYPETQCIVDGYVPKGLKVTDVVTINNLKHCWQFITENVDKIDKIDLDVIKELHKNIGAGLIDFYGQLRVYDARIGGTSWRPKIPNEFEVRNGIIDIMEKEISETEKALDLCLYLMRSQIFMDGNKRTAMMAANMLMIRNGCGVLSIPQDYQVEFFKFLVEFYETNDSKKIKEFLYHNCIDGMDFS